MEVVPRVQGAGHEHNRQAREERPSVPRHVDAIGSGPQVDVRQQGGQVFTTIDRLERALSAVNRPDTITMSTQGFAQVVAENESIFSDQDSCIMNLFVPLEL